MPPGLHPVGEPRKGEQLGPPGEPAGGELEGAPTAGQVVGQLVELHHAEGGRELRRLEVPTGGVKDEEVVVLEPVGMVPKKRSRPLPFSEPKICSSDRRPQRRYSRALSARSSSSTQIIPPVPAAVMMWDRAKLVSEMSARAPVGVPRKVRPSASQESSTTISP